MVHSWALLTAGLGTGSGLGFAHISNSLPRPWAALFSKSRHVSFQVADMERKTHKNKSSRPSFPGWRAARSCLSLRLEVDVIPVWQRGWGMKKSLLLGKSTPEDDWPYQALSLPSPMCISLLPARFSTFQRQAWDTREFSMWQTPFALSGRNWNSS